MTTVTVPGDMDSAIRVTVTPSQSSYFAGEPFSVLITFTNTRSPDLGPSKPSSRSHKRGAHSVSLAPIARPPTSPGTPRTPTSALPVVANPRFSEPRPARKGFIGKQHEPPEPNGSATLPDLIEQRRRKLLAKSQSVSISPTDLEDALGEAVFPIRSNTDPSQSPISPINASPLHRSHTFVLAQTHPHARKQSALDGQVSIIETQFHPMSPTSMPNSPLTPSASNTNLTLDTIAESNVQPYPPTPSASSPRIETPTTPTFDVPNPSHGYPPRKHQRSNSQKIGLGLPSTVNATLIKPEIREPPRTAFSSTFPQSNAELILYSYAQLSGTVTISPLPGTYTNPEQSYTLNALRSTLLKKRTIGGGSMDILSSVTSPTPTIQRRHSRSSSFSASLFSLLSPTMPTSASSPTTSSAQWSSGRGRHSSFSHPSGAGPFAPVDEADPDTPLPVVDVQPTMLAVDMNLLPGESKTYTYTVHLPDNLPPTYRGRTVRFSYELVIGTCRAGSGPGGSGPVGSNSISRVMRVPIRVYTNVSVGRSQTPYDLLWPVSKNRAVGNGTVVEILGHVAKSPSLPRVPSTSGSLEELKRYAHQLVNSDKDPVGLRQEFEDGGRERNETGALSGCREAVEVLTRNMKRASYDVNKDGIKVAVLTFTKSSYRLGETVLGVVELNELTSRSRVVQLSALLETQESLPISSGVLDAKQRHLRRVHAEHHSSFTLSTRRTTFALDIPSDASPAFQIKLSPDHGSPSPSPIIGGLEWKVRLKLSVAIAAESSDAGTEGVRFKSLVRDGPRGEWASSWRACSGVAPKQKLAITASHKSQKSWAAALADSLLGTVENKYHDGDEEDIDLEEEGAYDGIRPNRDGGVGTGVNFGGGETGWADIRMETVECEVPIKVWPGNTIFKAVDVVFDV